MRDPRTGKLIQSRATPQPTANPAPPPAVKTPLGQGLTTPTVPEPTPVQNQELTIEEMEAQAAELLKKAKDKRRLEPQKMTQEQYNNLLSRFTEEQIREQARAGNMLLPWE
ncbi:hypothetical protein AGMMS50276_30140 [Synergistales bacterium]|nr:hypothetical protein AGMMS50276_30140 [Synergistales bacterium]